MIDIVLFFVYAAVFWTGIFYVLQIIHKVFGIRRSQKEFAFKGHSSDRLYLGRASSYFLVVLALYNFLMSVTDGVGAEEFSSNAFAFVIFNLFVLAAFILMIRSIQSEKT